MNNDFVKGNPAVGIKTMFKPSDGEAYYERQKKKEAVEKVIAALV